MTDKIAAQPVARHSSGKRSGRRSKSLWARVRKPLASSRLAKAVITSLISQGLRLIRMTNPLASGSVDLRNVYEDEQPAIIAMWHGQHLLAPVYYPHKRGMVAMVSRSADAELNAMTMQKFGIDTVRGSGGRNPGRQRQKGGARALVALKKALDTGKNVGMIADIPHGTPRDAGMGIILLARISGRPIISVAITTSRRRILEKSWDKTTISLPFGRSGIAVGEPIYVDKDADDAQMESKRQQLTQTLNAITARAYALADGVK